MDKTRKDSYTPAELTLLKEIYENNTKDVILSKFQEMGSDRSWRSLYFTAKSLGLKRDREVIVQEMKTGGATAPTPPNKISWTEEEDDILKRAYPVESQDILVPQFKNRTWRAIRCRALALGLTRGKNAVDKDRAKHLKENLGVDSTWQLESVKEKSRQTNQEKRGVDYPTQSAEVRDKVKKTVQERYGVDNVFQAEDIKQKIIQTNIEQFGTANPNQSPEVRQKTTATNKEKYGVENTLQLVGRVQQGMKKKYGETIPLRVPEIKERQQQTNMERYGAKTPAENRKIAEKIKRILNTDEVREKKYETMKTRGTFKNSSEELAFYEHLKKLDPDAEHHKLHPSIKHVIDFYLPQTDLWIQYDGDYWHGLVKNCDGPQHENIIRMVATDQFQNENIPNLVRFSSGDVDKALKEGTIEDLIKNSIEDKSEQLQENPVCEQYKRKIKYYEEDIKNLPFNPDSLSASDFELTQEKLSDEIIAFIERYEWLGTIGVTPKWCFTARYKGHLSGVVLLNEPTTYSKILGEETPKYEALIQRGASASWAPKNLGSRLIMFACHWMTNNTDKRAFIGYADLRANERGIIYRACNFDYLGDHFGVSKLLRHPAIPKLFTEHDLKRTSAFRRWCSSSNIKWEKNWFKENGFKNLETIPTDIKRSWYEWNRKIVLEAEKLNVEKKMKYVLILGRNKKETNNFRKLRQYQPQPYPTTEKKSICYSAEKIALSGRTRSRHNSAKTQFIIDHYGKMTVPKMAEELKETARWVKRSLKDLTRQGKIIRIRPHKSVQSESALSS